MNALAVVLVSVLSQSIILEGQLDDGADYGFRGASLAQVENEFGADAVRVVLAREAEVTTAWETLLQLSR